MLIEWLQKCGLLPLEPPTEEEANDERRFWVEMRRRTSQQGDEALFAREYELLRTDERVHEFLVSDEGSVLLTTRVLLPKLSRGSWPSRPVYLGTYTILLRSADMHVKAPGVNEYQVPKGFVIACKESGRHDGILQHKYYLTNGIGKFCFGSRTDFMAELLRWKEYYQALALTLDSLWHINPDDRTEVERTFRCIQDDGTIEPTRALTS